MKFNGPYINSSTYNRCGFAKYDNHPLFLVCCAIFLKSLAEIEKEIELNNINAKYNFKIQPVINNEIIDLNRSKDENYFVYIDSEVLDFTTEDSLNISFVDGFFSSFEGLRFNIDAEDLKCEKLRY